MSSQFSAGPQAIGYSYQARHALYALIQDDREEVAIRIEALDDVDRSSIEGITLEQLKHHINSEAKLTVSSVDLWKSLRVWSEGLRNRDWNPNNTILHLITTAQIPETSAITYLRYGLGRDVEKAYQALLEVIGTSSNRKLTSSFDSFNALDEDLQKSLLKAVYVQDMAPSIGDLPSLIKKKIKWGINADHLDSVYERLEGWWFEKITNHLLNKSIEKITQLDVHDKIQSINEQFKRSSLPIDYDDVNPTDEYLAALDNRLFVHQLNLIKVNTKRIQLCILDFYKAFEQRSRWVREQLLIDDELQKYERRLIKEWERYVSILEDELNSDSDQDLETFGKRLLNYLEASNITIRSEMPLGHEYVMRGSYHILADFNPPHVYWHPKCLDKLEELINQSR